MDMGKNGSTIRPFKDEYERFLYTLQGAATLGANERSYEMIKGSYAYLPPGMQFSISHVSDAPFRFLMIKRKYIPADSGDPRFICTNEKEMPEEIVQGENRSRKYLMPMDDIAYDMAVNKISFKPGAGLGIESHIQHHGIYMLEGTCLWYLGSKWHQSEAGDFIWLAPFAPQAAWFTGVNPGSYLLYKNWNR